MRGTATSTETGITFYHPFAFWSGVVGIVAGVLSHIPMFMHAASTGYKMVGMPMDNIMLVGMGCIVVGVLLAWYGLSPGPITHSVDNPHAAQSTMRMRAIDDAPLTRAHVRLILVIVVAVVVDVMKPATLGFVVPGMTIEYGLSKYSVALFPLSALTGTTVGSFLWGALGDAIGRRATILLSALLFMATAICGAMPTFAWNVAMCFLMGMSAGGLLPTAFTLTAETIPAKHRGWILVLLGGLGTAGGYLAASGFAALLEPHFGWRILWFLGLPTGLTLIILNRYIPESPRFLLLHGHTAEAHRVMNYFGAVTLPDSSMEKSSPAYMTTPTRRMMQLFNKPYVGLSVGLTLCGIAWGLVNFGFLLWLPSNLRAAGMSVTLSNAVLAKGALIAFPAAILVTWLYHSWSSKKTLVVATFLTATTLLLFSVVDPSTTASAWILIALVVALLACSGGVIAMLIPYSTEIYPLRVRATGTGFVAGASKLGGILGVSIGVPAFISGVAASALVTAIPVFLSAWLLSLRGIETRGRRLEEIHVHGPVLEAIPVQRR